jgi:hypothetical protein
MTQRGVKLMICASDSHQAQPCYCDEPNCVGSIGGKTQTDVGGMDDLYLDGLFNFQSRSLPHSLDWKLVADHWFPNLPCSALGIADEVEALGLKGNKKKKGKKLGEDFMVRPPSFPACINRDSTR